MTAVKLDKPGAGLPFPENLIARYIIYPMQMREFSAQKSIALFLRESERMATRAETLADDVFFTPVLIDRLRGLEDSSRNWSAAMTLEHLLLTMRPMAMIIEGLAKGDNMKAHIDTADFKPKGGRNVPKGDWLNHFRAASNEVAERLSTAAATLPAFTKSNGNTLRHPFFGQIDARGWLWVLGVHQNTHRKQIKNIVAALNN